MSLVDSPTTLVAPTTIFSLGEWRQRPAYHVREEDALSVTAVFCACHNVSERIFEIEHVDNGRRRISGQTFNPFSSRLATPDKIGGMQDLGLWLNISGQGMQTESTSKMMFPIAMRVSYIIRVMHLMPGAIITAGTPPVPAAK